MDGRAREPFNDHSRSSRHKIGPIFRQKNMMKNNTLLSTSITIIPLNSVRVVNSRAEMDVPFVSLQRLHGGG